ncbi:MAG TPA: hypothetical protein VGX23_31130 [Actinocrinis sp.]|nr:hypothetical protein [Actinocrinis sp.]
MDVGYQSMLVVAEAEPVCGILRRLDQQALVAPAGPGLTAVVPGRGDWLPIELAEKFSRQLRTASLYWAVDEPTWVEAKVFDQGEGAHRYSSHPILRYEELPPEPLEPLGAETGPFAPFGTDRLDEAALLRALRGEPAREGEPKPPPRQQHRLIVEALGLDPALLTADFDHALARAAEFPGAVHVSTTLD